LDQASVVQTLRVTGALFRQCTTCLVPGMKRKREMKTKIQIMPACNGSDLKGTVYSHRLHYHWSNLEADRSGKNIGSPSCPCPKVDRFLRLNPRRKRNRQYFGKLLRRQAHFNLCASLYKTVDYNTFAKNGVLKLTEVELYFLSSVMTKSSSDEWALVYLGVGNGERFRHLRDEFFPGLSVIAFDPLDAFFDAFRTDIERSAELWSNDGSNFIFLVRCFDLEADINWIKEKFSGKRLLLISDIRGCNLKDGGTRFDTAADQELQWQAIQRLCPERSLVKFNNPEGVLEFDYAPGLLLKQIYCYYGTTELRLLIDGVPTHSRRYDIQDLFEQVQLHSDRLRGQVYATERHCDRFKLACLDCCFDCTVLWNTVSSYAEKNSRDPYEMLDSVLRNSLYDTRQSFAPWGDVGYYLNNGRLTEAMSTLDSHGAEDESDIDVSNLVDSLSAQQPALADRLTASLPRRASCADIIKLVGSLSNPFTLVKSELNGLLQYPSWTWTRGVDQARRKACSVDMSYYKKELCWYYKRGIHCSKGSDCTYKHGEDDVGTWTAENAYDAAICWHFQKGSCNFGNRCFWRHETADAST